MANWFIRPSSAGSATGSDWNNAWSITNLNSNWASVAAGDTIWLAGGSYSTELQFAKSGSAGNVITVKRATASDSAATSAAGWSSGFDVQVVISSATCVSYSSTGNGNYTALDGNVTDGIKLSFPADAFDSAGILFYNCQIHDVSFTKIDMAGPAGNTPYAYTGDAACFNFRTGGVGGDAISNVTVTNCKLHGCVNLAYNDGVNHDVTFNNCKFYDNGSSSGSFHANMVFTNGLNYNWRFRNCEFYNWQVEGIVLYQMPAPSYPITIDGCIFHDPMDSGARCLWLASEPSGGIPQGPVHLVNNTFYNVNVTVDEDRASQFGSTSLCKNNIFWVSPFGTNSALPSGADYNFSSGSTSGANSISSGSNPFVSGSDFHIISTIGSTYPRNKGVDAGSTYNADPDGRTRGADGAWDMGAYEFGGGTQYAFLTLRTSKPLSAISSFVGNLVTSFIHGGTAFTKSLTASLSFVGAMSARIIATRAFTATLSFVGVSSRRANKAFAPTLSFVSAMVKRITDAGFSAILSFIGNVIPNFISGAGHLFFKAFDAILFPSTAAAYYHPLTVNHALVPSTQTDFPVLISVTDATLKTVANGGHVQRSDGFDIGFYSDSAGTTKLKWEMESYDGSAGTIVAWVKIPSLSSSSDTVFYLRCGSTAITTDQSDPVNVWSNGYVGVWHLGDGTTVNTNDSLGLHNGTIGGPVAAVAGQIRGGAWFQSPSYMAFGDIGLNNTPLTFEMWVAPFNNVFAALLHSTSWDGHYLSHDPTGVNFGATSVANTFAVSGTAGKASAGSMVWQHMVAVFASDSSRQVFVNGSAGTVETTTVVPGATPNAFILGADWSFGNNFYGYLDEVRMSSVARSADWITTTYNAQSAPSTFMSLGGEGTSVVLAVSLVKRVTHTLSATLLFVSAITKRISRALSATLSFIGSMSARIIATRAFTATLNATATLSRSTRKALSATLSATASLVRRITHSLSAILSSAGALGKVIRDAGFSATLSFVGNLVGIAVHFFTRAFTATTTFSATLTRSRIVQRVLAASLAFSGALQRKIGKALSATLGFSAAIRSVIRKVFAATLGLLAFLFKGGAVTVLAGWITRCFATIGIGGSTAAIVKAGSQLTIEKLDESGVQIQVTGSQLTVERTK